MTLGAETVVFSPLIPLSLVVIVFAILTYLLCKKLVELVDIIFDKEVK